MRETILVTGGSGFIGINLVLRLLKSTPHNIIVLTRMKMRYAISKFPRTKRVSFVYSNILQKNLLERAVKKSTIIIHLASDTNPIVSLVDTIKMIRSNIVGTTNVLELAQKYKIKRVILLSSGGVYGNRVKGRKMDEKHPLCPITPYAVSKLSADLVANTFFSNFKTPIIILRPFNVYGPHQSINKVIPIFITKLLRNLPIVLNHGGKQKRDFVYIDDLIFAIELVLKAPIDKVVGETFNISSDYAVPMRKIADIIIQKLGKARTFLEMPKKSNLEVLDSSGSSDKIKKVLRWSPNFSLERGLSVTIAWYKSEQNYEQSK